ncbi:MAG: hypothetical protein JWP57_4537, partial [Spirosoma sp.]|nr:hypothetical protein [Spirosoma sp.]
IASYHVEAAGGVYEEVDQTEMDRAIRAHRLASPDHYRIYFAFAQPANAPGVGDFTDLAEATSLSAGAAAELLRRWHGQRLTSGVTRAEIMLDRLAAAGLTMPTADEAEHLLIAYSNVMDELAEQSVDDFGGPDVWRRAMRSLPALFEALGDARQAVMRRMFADGAALAWLTSIFRRETFAHGRHGDRPDSHQLLTDAELDVVGETMLARYRAMSFADFAAGRQPLSMLFAWQQGGDQDGPQRLVGAEILTDTGLLDVLEHLSGRVLTATPTSTREHVTLSRSNIATLVDYDEVRRRIERLAEGGSDETTRTRAGSLLESFRNGDRF